MKPSDLFWKKHIVRMCALLCLCPLLLSGCARGPWQRHATIDEGMERMNEGAYEEALTLFSAALAAGESKRSVYRGRGITYYKMGEYDEAIASFDTALKATDGILDAMDYDMNYYLAACYEGSGRYEMAVAVYSTILSLKEKDADAWYLRGRARLRQKDTAGAASDFLRAVELKPQDYDRIFLIYEDYEAAGFVSEGKEFLSAQLQEQEASLTDYERGRFHYYLGDLSGAMEYLESARSGSGAQVIEAVLLLGRAAEESGDFDYAEGIYRSYLKNNRENARVYNQLGLCELNNNRLDAAISDFEAGISLDDASMRQDLAWNIIVAYEYKGEFGTARDLTRQYLERYPTDDKALREYQFLSTR